MDETDENTGFIQNTLNNFALKLFKAVSNENEKNIMLSPYSISTALTMCYFGSREHTSNELRELLCLQQLTDAQILSMHSSYLSFLSSELGTDTSLELANKLYLSNRFKINSNFQANLKENFRTEMEEIEFTKAKEAAETMNEWIGQKTNSKITHLVDSIHVNDSLALVILNAVYFKAKWSHVFEEGLTEHDADFYASDGTVLKCDMMELRRKTFKLYKNPLGLRANVLEIPYDHFTLSCTIILPDIDGSHLDDILGKLDAKILNNLLRSNHEVNSLVNLHLPKFKFESKFELEDVFKKLGCTIPLDAQRADFSLMKENATKSGGDANRQPLCISKVLHETVIDVDEFGTEATAATAAFMRLGCSMNREEPFEFVCNRPFLFVIHEKNHNGVLFIGKFVRP